MVHSSCPDPSVMVHRKYPSTSVNVGYTHPVPCWLAHVAYWPDTVLLSVATGQGVPRVASRVPYTAVYTSLDPVYTSLDPD